MIAFKTETVRIITFIEEQNFIFGAVCSLWESLFAPKSICGIRSLKNYSIYDLIKYWMSKKDKRKKSFWFLMPIVLTIKISKETKFYFCLFFY